MSAFIVGGSGSPGVEEISLINAPRLSIVINGDKKEGGGVKELLNQDLSGLQLVFRCHGCLLG